MRDFIQSKLEEISNVEIGPEIPDDMLEENTTYFSYSLYKNYQDSDYDNNFTYRVSIIGFVKRLRKSNENTLKIVDNTSDEIIEKLKELNVKSSSEDVSIENNVQKIKITGNVTFSEINNCFI